MQPEESDSEQVIVEETSNDPLASFDTSDLWVMVGTREFLIPYMPASAWLTVLLTKSLTWWDVLPGLLDEGTQIIVEDMILDETLTVKMLEEAAQNLVSAVTGRTWWFSINFLSVCREAWTQIAGDMALARVNPYQIPIAAWMDAAWTLVLRHVDPNKVSTFVSILRTPPEGVVIEVASEENDAAFLASLKTFQTMHQAP